MDSKLVISCRMMNILIKIYHVVQELQAFSRIAKVCMDGRTDSHRDNSAHLRVLEFFFHCDNVK